MGKVILKESQLRNIIKESVTSILNEWLDYDWNDHCDTCDERERIYRELHDLPDSDEEEEEEDDEDI